MLGWVIACRDECAQVLLDKLENAFGPLARCRAINFRRGMSSNMLSRMMCDALHDTDVGEGVIFLTDKSGEAPYRTASLMSHKHSHCEVISGISYELLAQMLPLRESLSSEAFRNAIVALDADNVSSLWHQQQKNPPFVLLHDLYAS
ncbi:PTS sugar transporter subunit IIA [Pluralibacter gergoviae]|uniref:PTS sugar transporter subunit IIA n=1 Tax=Pluralibacter gergoviae TaxID=61647 RepID=UPI000A3C541D|nr:PTS sugar transporter subunit IIA [Pluralibacter gergoviae]EKT9638901.1 PTS sugar transporter subunit IIA [Pluralibacter gergoviae]EKV3542047.1 PTS sugar transporter subunit IIA [Pluralibacter gergoviae]EKV9896823.1 PTS sugar transporter subunit IIA [Pluralibacter gergoviae]EKV9928873.1 PTS sugar transporter subunit IIA [Pluralibacter gergoviae]EKW9974327.1 PTS sugar transporter subunit IIA [Pluralibacter gergoviae]